MLVLYKIRYKKTLRNPSQKGNYLIIVLCPASPTQQSWGRIPVMSLCHLASKITYHALFQNYIMYLYFFKIAYNILYMCTFSKFERVICGTTGKCPTRGQLPNGGLRKLWTNTSKNVVLFDHHKHPGSQIIYLFVSHFYKYFPTLRQSFAL